MKRPPLALFVVSVVLPAIAYFIFAYLKIGDASKVLDVQKTISEIIDNTPNEAIRPELVSEVREIVELVSEDLAIVADRQVDRNLDAKQTSKELSDLLRAADLVLDNAGYKEGTFVERISLAIDGTQVSCPEAPKPKICPKPIKPDCPDLSTPGAIWKSGENSYDLFFGFWNESLTPPIEAALETILKGKSTTLDPEVYLFGFADRVGSPEFNCELSKRRLREVVSFIDKRFPDLAVISEARGEIGVPHFPEQDERREPRNRIVRIFLGNAPEQFLTGSCD